jgi:hypothetical protein
LVLSLFVKIMHNFCISGGDRHQIHVCTGSRRLPRIMGDRSQVKIKTWTARKLIALSLSSITFLGIHMRKMYIVMCVGLKGPFQNSLKPKNLTSFSLSLYPPPPPPLPQKELMFGTNAHIPVPQKLKCGNPPKLIVPIAEFFASLNVLNGS